MSAEQEIRTVAQTLAAVAAGSSVTVREPYRLAGEMAERLHEAGLLLTPEKAAELSAAAPRVVYRAEHESIVLGQYTTPAAARAHCEAVERRAWLTGTPLTFDWVEDEEDGVAELVIEARDGEPETTTGYVVTALDVATEYDEEADE